jgi:hypothetical protein
MRLTGKEEGKLSCDVVMKDGELTEVMRFDNMRDMRYCEVFLICGDVGANVYNTIGLNNEKNPKDTCPDSIMVNFSTGAVMEQYDVQGVFLNGPRNFILDSMNIPTGTMVRDFKGLKARWMGNLHLPPGVSLGAKKTETAYIPTTIDRKSEFFFVKGQPVFILDDPEGTPWVMKSYTNRLYPDLTYENLKTLDRKLKLPPGWKYRIKVLDQNLELRPFKGTARITQDELQNTYDACDKGACNYQP